MPPPFVIPSGAAATVREWCTVATISSTPIWQRPGGRRRRRSRRVGRGGGQWSYFLEFRHGRGRYFDARVAGEENDREGERESGPRHEEGREERGVLPRRLSSVFRSLGRWRSLGKSERYSRSQPVVGGVGVQGRTKGPRLGGCGEASRDLDDRSAPPRQAPDRGR
jgi:hypothetical protein